ncbi:lipopolysaccharide-binding protein-like [Mercenaria mercenaria]|uniref:lipopolysaccharide-binding protein-like n=1 Tax=Mercenaria mercenaria TaxID=6596 RepID=UPI00234F6894|nr:lipopolysaccharide-binding protein-like [Mercenaria mercenaria]XP_053402307.1 lipopolysaccharide-binding protein-like [Mercenaria mercenaria]
MMRLDIIACLLCLCILQVYARNPGFKARITNKGLKYANDVAIQALKANVQKLKIPNQSGKASGFKYDITNINVQQFNPPTSTLGIVPGDGLSWKGSNAAIKVHGDFHYKKWFISDGGSFDASVSGVSFSLGVDIGNDVNGRPTIAARSCSSNVADVSFKFHGGMAWLYNLFRSKVEGVIKDTLKKQMCTLINKEINEDGEKKLAKLKVTTPLGKKFLLDYRLTQKPSFQTQYMETFHKGEIFWLSSPTTESPLIPPPMPTNTDTDSMLYLWVSDYMFDTIGYTAQKHGFLVYNMTQKDLPPSGRGVLNTTCDGFIPKCIGKLIPQIGEKFPNSVVELRMNSTQTPTMNVSSAGVSLNFAGKIDLYATKPGTSSTPFLLSLNAIMFTTVNVSIQNELLYARINDLKLKLKVGKSAVGKVSDVFLDFLIKQALNAYLIPQLNDLGKKGFPLPVTGEIKFTNTKISFAKDTVLISTDLSYTPSSQDPSDDLSGPLKFKPSNRVHTSINIL